MELQIKLPRFWPRDLKETFIAILCTEYGADQTIICQEETGTESTGGAFKCQSSSVCLIRNDFGALADRLALVRVHSGGSSGASQLWRQRIELECLAVWFSIIFYPWAYIAIEGGPPRFYVLTLILLDYTRPAIIDSIIIIIITMASPRRRIIGLSTKMYFSLQRTHDFTTSALAALDTLTPETRSKLDIFIIPDFVTLYPTAKLLESSSSSVWLGAQDTHWEDSGAFTGEVSPSVLKEVGVRIVEVGHAERRRIFGENDEITAKKAAAVARNGMIPLVCIGEKTEGDFNIAVDECQVQVDAVMAAVSDDAEVVLAYEPVWAIGASQPTGEEHVLAVVRGIRELASVKGRAGSTRVVYGGSAGPGLYERLKEGVDGLFLGRFGHDPAQFVKTVREVAEA
jgi:triosephosphate isomerase